MTDSTTNPIEQAKPSGANTPPPELSVQIPRAAVPARVSAFEPTEFYALLKLIVSDASLSPTDKQKLIDELRKTTPTSDRWTFRWAIWILGSVVLLTVGALWALSQGGHNIPDGLVAIGSAAAGGLAGLLTPGRDQSQ